MADRTIAIALEAKVAGFVAGMSAAKRSVGGLMTDLEKSAAKRSALQGLGTAARNVGLVAAGGLALAVKSAADFDQAMSRIDAATHESGKNMALLRQAALDWGAKTAFSAGEAADGITELAKAGVSTADILHGGLGGALSLAAAGEVSVADAAETAATAMTQFGLTGKDVPHIADLLAAGANKAQGEVSDLSMALKQSGIVASQMGFGINETIGTLADFAHAGLIGSDAGTSFRTMLLRLANPTKQSANLMKQLGINVYDANGNMLPMAGIAGQLQDAFKGQSQQTRNAALATIFGSDAIRAANILYKEGASGIKEWTNKVNDAGYAADTAARKQNNLKGDLEKLGGSLSTALIGTGEGAQGLLRGIVQGLTAVTDAYNRLPSPAKGGVAAALGLTAIGGLGVYAFTRIVTGINNARTALQELGLTAGKTRAVLAGMGKGVEFAAIIYGLNQLDEQLDKLTHSNLQIDDLHRSLQSLAQGRINTTILDTFGSDLHGFQNNLDDFLSGFQHNVQGPLEDLVPGTSRLDEAEANIRGLDESLAQMAESGDAKTAAAAFAVLQAKAVASGHSVSELRSAFPQYTAAVKNAGDASGKTSGQFGDVGNAAKDAARQVLTFKGALQQLTGILDKRDALRSYQAAIDEFRKGFKHIQGPDFNINKEAGRQNQALLDAIASSAKNVAQKLHGVARVEFVQNAIGQLRAMANQMNLPKRQVDVLIAALVKLAHTSANPHVGVTFGNSFQQIRTLTSELRAIDNYNPTSTVTIETRRIGGPAPVTGATGGLLRGPGTGTSDSIPMWGSNGEYMMRESSVRKYGVAMMHDINAGRFATGGSVTMGRRNGSGGGSMTATVSAPLVAKIYDTDGIFVGSMRGEITDDHDMTATLRRQGVG